MENIVKIKKVLIIRNDTTTAWRDSTYILEKGEIGIGWLLVNEEKKPIVKIGDGKHLWIDLPQSEYVFLEDLHLSYDFGRHKTDNGMVNAGGNGMTISEWIKDALVARFEPIITQPDFSLFIDKIETDTGTCEIGSNVNNITWSTKFNPGRYEYGSYGDRTNFIPEVETLYYAEFNGEVLFDGNSTGIPSGDINPNVQISAIGENLCGNIKASVTWSDATNEPANNLGEKASGKITTGNKMISQDVYITGYREGCFYGGTNMETSIDTIRNLNTLGDNYSAQVVDFAIEPGVDKILIAYDSSCVGPTSIYNTSVNAEMIDNFTIEEIEIPGANGFTPITYKVMTYMPAEAYINPANITMTLG